jgi:hypothetical protein
MTLPSWLAVTIRCPFGENSAFQTHQLCPWKVCSGLPEARSHRIAVSSYELVSSCFPSGENATLKTPSVWPASVVASFPVAASTIRIA